jgi:pimeloyl-ACP methyl ester carboxylesterase
MLPQFAISTDGTHIAFDITGDGPALMLLHGAGKTRKDWHKLGYVARLQENFTVITMDLRGTGESDYLVEIEDYAIEKICQDLDAVADTCGVERFAIWGFSLGGNIARYPAARSDRVSAIAVVGVPFGPAVDQVFDEQIVRFEKKYAPLVDQQKLKPYPAKNRTPIKGQMVSWLACFRAMRGWPGVDPGEIRCPAILVVGTKNKNTLQWVDKNREELVQAGIELQILDGLNHNQEFEKIDRSFPVISQFFRDNLNEIGAPNDE